MPLFLWGWFIITSYFKCFGLCDITSVAVCPPRCIMETVNQSGMWLRSRWRNSWTLPFVTWHRQCWNSQKTTENRLERKIGSQSCLAVKASPSLWSRKVCKLCSTQLVRPQLLNIGSWQITFSFARCKGVWHNPLLYTICLQQTQLLDNRCLALLILFHSLPPSVDWR